ncbi:hypothetical protein HF086_004898 [Spodoptera exigua]|uniref:Uncharacterized protein n=1 Tax=Spodoptera exigua TaxID=7107 RepID=A0A922MTD5_SPOEX|nr:hypothetical protein HF086_004898 [Spodoptera exigua]
MNKLALQSACFENIKTLANNYNKDSKTRKTKEYLNKRLTSLEAQWVDFNTRHTLLSQEIEDKNINYFMDDICGDQISSRITFDFKQDETMKTLGLGWNPRADTFVFNWKFQENVYKITKRQLLSEISQLYDPLGWLSPITIAAKIIFQKCGSTNLIGDDQLPLHIADKWLKLRADITNVKYINVKLARFNGAEDRTIWILRRQ